MLRTIFHLDMDSYFASVEQQCNPRLRGLPIGITGKPTERTIIVTASREGKRYGLKAGMPVWEAQKLCPRLVLVPGDGTRYLATTQRFLDILKRFTPRIEVSSIDEVYMDVTQEVPRHGGPVEMAQTIQRAFRQELGAYITATIGIADNKTFAKLIGKRFKPNGIGVVDPEELPELLETTPVAEICGIGRRMERRLLRLGVRTLAELGRCPLSYLEQEFGIYGQFCKAVGLGQDPTPLVPYTRMPPPKSVGHSRTLPPDIRPRPLALMVLRGLCDLVAGRLRKYGFMARTVHCGFSLEVMGGHHSKQVTLPIPTDDGAALFEACERVLSLIPIQPENMARMSVSVSNLVLETEVPMPLLPEDQVRRRLNRAVDLIQARYGRDVIQVAAAVLPRQLPDHVGGFAETGSFTFSGDGLPATMRHGR